jgi:hypothetical protein
MAEPAILALIVLRVIAALLSLAIQLSERGISVEVTIKRG